MGTSGLPVRGKRRRWAFVPPLLILGVSLGSFAYRLSVSDWYWGPAPARKAPVAVAWAEPPGLLSESRVPNSATVPAPEDAIAEKPEPEPDRALSQNDGPKAATAPAESSPSPSDAVAGVKPEPESLDPEESIRRQAERTREHRDEIARLKEHEAERLDRNPPQPEPRFGAVNPAQIEALLRRQLAMRREMEAMMEARIRGFGFGGGNPNPGQRAPGRRAFPAPPPLPWNGLGRGFPKEMQADVDRMFDEVFRMRNRPWPGVAPADPTPPPPGPGLPVPPRRIPGDPPPPNEAYSRSFT